MRFGRAEETQQQQQQQQDGEEIEGVSVPCRDAKRRVWQAMDLLVREHKINKTTPNGRMDTAASVEQPTPLPPPPPPPLAKDSPRHRAAAAASGGGIL